MARAVRELHRCAYLLLPGESLNAERLDQVRAEGYTDIGVWFRTTGMRTQFPGQGFAMDQARTLAELAVPRSLGLIAFTGYMKYQEELIRQQPERSMVVGAPKRPGDLPTRSLCPFRPENKRDYLAFLLEIAVLPGVRQIYLNDEAQLAASPAGGGPWADVRPAGNIEMPPAGAGIIRGIAISCNLD